MGAEAVSAFFLSPAQFWTLRSRFLINIYGRKGRKRRGEELRETGREKQRKSGQIYCLIYSRIILPANTLNKIFCVLFCVATIRLITNNPKMQVLQILRICFPCSWVCGVVGTALQGLQVIWAWLKSIDWVHICSTWLSSTVTGVWSYHRSQNAKQARRIPNKDSILNT